MTFSEKERTPASGLGACGVKYGVKAAQRRQHGLPQAVVEHKQISMTADLYDNLKAADVGTTSHCQFRR